MCKYTMGLNSTNPRRCLSSTVHLGLCLIKQLGRGKKGPLFYRAALNCYSCHLQERDTPDNYTGALGVFGHVILSRVLESGAMILSCNNTARNNFLEDCASNNLVSTHKHCQAMCPKEISHSVQQL